MGSLVLGVLLTFLCLWQVTRNMRRVMAGRIERAMNRTLQGSAWLGVGLGILITMAVQSSSITTSLLVPMCAAGVMRLRNAFPIMLGANVGTTVTALLASLAQDSPDALTIALVHVMFNTLGLALCMTVPPGADRADPPGQGPRRAGHALEAVGPGLRRRRVRGRAPGGVVGVAGVMGGIPTRERRD